VLHPAELAPVIPELEAHGHRAIAVDLRCTAAAAALDDNARTVVDAMAGIAGRGRRSPCRRRDALARVRPDPQSYPRP
jgi:hypothetical protein